MSEVKLYVHTSTIVYDKFFQQEMESVGLRPATTAEKMEGHPRCKDCRHYATWEELSGSYYIDDDGHMQPDYFTMHDCNRAFESIDAEHYCRHWEGKG